MDAANNVGKIRIKNIADLLPQTLSVRDAPPTTPPQITKNIENEDTNDNTTTGCKSSITKADLSKPMKSAATYYSTTKKAIRINKKNDLIIGQIRIDSFFKSASKNFNIEPLKPKSEHTGGSIRKCNNNTSNTKTKSPAGKLLAKKKTGRKRLFTSSDSDSVITIESCNSSNFEPKPRTKESTKLKTPRKQLRRSARNLCANKPEATIVDLTLDIDESDNEVNKEIEPKTLETIIEAVTLETMAKDQRPAENDANNTSNSAIDDVKTPPSSNAKDDGKHESQQIIISSKNGKIKQVPPYKIIEDTTFAVDAFNYGDIPNVTHYFLTHYHADHYVGLSGKFQNILYATKTTIRLISTFMPSVDKKYLHELELNEPLIVENVEVTAIDANHCPGAVMLVFKLKTGKCILHTGDFRACSNMESEPVFWNNHISLIYLDTTYLSDKYNFCHQSESIDKAIDIIEKFQEKHAGKKILYVCGTYLVGKEYFWTSLAQYFGWKVWAESQRYKSLTALENPQIDEKLCQDIKKAQLHVIPLMKLRYDCLLEYFLKVETDHEILFALRPSGWEKNSRPQYRGAINIVGIEYSEHSSNKELERFVKFLKPDRVISTISMPANPFVTDRVPLNWYKYKGYAKMLRNVQLSITAFTKNLSATTNRPTTISNEVNISKFVVSPIKKRSNGNDENINRENAIITTKKTSDDKISIEQHKSTIHKKTISEVPKPPPHNHIYEPDADDDWLS